LVTSIPYPNRTTVHYHLTSKFGTGATTLIWKWYKLWISQSHVVAYFSICGTSWDASTVSINETT